jgi:hypothetical protein
MMLQSLRRCAERTTFPAEAAGKDKIAVRIARISSRIASAASESGTRCSFPAFMRSAGIVQHLSAIFISFQRALFTSTDQPAVKIVNSSARSRTLLLPQLDHEAINFKIRQRRMVLDASYLVARGQ